MFDVPDWLRHGNQHSGYETVCYLWDDAADCYKQGRSICGRFLLLAAAHRVWLETSTAGFNVRNIYGLWYLRPGIDGSGIEQIDDGEEGGSERGREYLHPVQVLTFLLLFLLLTSFMFIVVIMDVYKAYAVPTLNSI